MRVCLFLRLLLSASERETDVHRLIYLSNSNAVFFFQNCTHYYFEFNFCKVIRVDNAYNQIQVINKDRPAYTKTDKQYHTRKTYYSTATRPLSTALKDKNRMYDRLRNNKPITTGSRTLLIEEGT